MSGSRASGSLAAAALVRAYTRSLLHGFFRVSLGRKVFRLAIVAVACEAWWLTFEACHFGLTHLTESQALAAAVVGKLFDVTLLLLFSVLTFSSVLVALAHVFLSDGLAFLATLPVATRTLYFVKWVEVCVVAGWMPVVFGSAVLAAFGAACGAPPAYYWLGLLCLFLFVTIPTALGISLTSVLVNFFPAHRTRDLLLVLALLLLVVVFLVVRSMQPERLVDPTAFKDFTEAVAHLDLPVAGHLPAAWAARALRPYLRGETAASWPHVLRLIVGAAVAFCIGLLAFEALFRRGVSRTLSARGRGVSENGVGSYLFSRLTGLLPRTVGAIARKDILQFGRDATQWSQLVLVAALVLIYLFNVYFFPVDDIPVGKLTREVAADLLACLNLAMAGFVLTAVALRFVFASVSTEGRAVWVVLQAPIRARTILGAKVAVWMPFLWCFGVVLVGGSCLILKSSLAFTAASMVVMSLLVVGISGVGVGLGATMPSFRADNPAKVIGSFGGMVFMLVALLYTGLLLLLMGMPLWVLHCLSRGKPVSGIELVLAIVSLVIAAIAATAATLLPLWLGARSLEQRN